MKRLTDVEEGDKLFSVSREERTMKVLSNNNFIKATCPHCKSSLGVHLGDIRYNEIPHRCSEFEATCGACGRTVGIDGAVIPRSWIRSLVPDDSGH
jgi:hypothetical protein